jgi:hypothetical protein
VFQERPDLLEVSDDVLQVATQGLRGLLVPLPLQQIEDLEVALALLEALERFRNGEVDALALGKGSSGACSRGFPPHGCWADIPLSGRVVEGELPAGRYVSMTYTGPYDDLMDVTAMLVGWAKEKGVRWDSEPTGQGESFVCRLEVHDNNPSIEPDPNKLQTTLLFKLADN